MLVANIERVEKNLLQRTFVKASDAANAKIKDRIKLSPHSIISSNKKTPIQLVKSEKRSVLDRLGHKLETNESEIKNPSKKKRKDFQVQSLSDVILVFRAYNTPGLPKVWLTLRNSIRLLGAKIVVDYQYLESGVIKCNLYVSNILIAEVEGESREETKNEAAKQGLKFLSESCYTLKIFDKQVSNSAIIELDDIDSQSKEKRLEVKSISEDNIGSRLLRLMGWSGGGLGKAGDGIVEPVKAVETGNRRGLGCVVNKEGLGVTGTKVSPLFIRNVENELIIYNHSDRIDDLIFSEDLSKSQREKIHAIVRSKSFRGLKSVSHGSGINRRIAVTRKFADNASLVQHILENGGVKDKYELFLPGTMDIVSECLGDIIE